MMTDQEKELLRLLALKMSWPRNGGRDEFDTDVKLDRAIDRAMVAVFKPVVLRRVDPEAKG